MDYIPDPIERMNDRIERHIDELYDHKTGMMQCSSCRVYHDVDELVSIDADPSAAPVCRPCAVRITGMDV